MLAFRNVAYWEKTRMMDYQAENFSDVFSRFDTTPQLLKRMQNLQEAAMSVNTEKWQSANE